MSFYFVRRCTGTHDLDLKTSINALKLQMFLQLSNKLLLETYLCADAVLMPTGTNSCKKLSSEVSPKTR